MNPLVNTEFVFSLGALLLGMGMFNCKRLRATLSQFKQWWLSTDYMNSIAAGLALMMLLLVNYSWY